MMDLHTHVLPGLDDGCADLDESVELCRKAASEGVRMLAATPHVRHDYAVTPDRMSAALDDVRSAVDGLIEVLPGGEVDLDELYRPLEELQAFGLAGNPSYLLIETPYVGWRSDIAEDLERLRAVDITPVLAHPERNAAVQARPKLLLPLVAAGTLVQLTAASVDGRGGRAARTCAFRLLELEAAHLIASDAHSPRVREVGLRGAVDALDDADLARWLTVDVPGAIVAGGTSLPERPRGSRSLMRRFRRAVGN